MSRTFLIIACAASLGSSFAAQAPVNDVCANAIPVFDGVNPNPPTGVSGSFYTNVGAGTDGSCSCGFGYGTLGDVWFTYTAQATGIAVVRLCRPAGFTFGSIPFPCVAVFTGCGGTELSCSAPGSPCLDGSPGTLMFAGNTYLIRVASITTQAGGTGYGTFYLTIIPPQGFPSNDHCANALQVSDGINPAAPAGISGYRFWNIAAANEGAASCDATSSASDVWFSYTAPASGVVVVRTCNPTGMAQGWGQVSLSVFAGCGGAELACTTLATANCPPMTPQAAFVAAAGSTYIIRAATFGGLFASFYLTIIPPGPPPPNDNCANAIPVGPGLYGPFSNAGATQDGASSCITQPSVVRDVWFSHVPAASGVISFSTSAIMSLQPTENSAFASCGGAQLACSNPVQDLFLTVTGGVSYLFRVADYPNLQGYAGSFYLTISNPAPPLPNDECSGAIPILPGSNGPFSTFGATTSAGAPSGSVDAWFSFTTGACAGAYSIEECPYAAVGLSVHAACGGPPVQLFPDPAAPACGGTRATFLSAPFSTWFIRAYSPPGYNFNFNLTVKTPTTGAQAALAFGSPLGPTSIQAILAGLPPNGFYYFPFTTTLWTPASPNNFFGLDMTFAELFALYAFGPPFVGTTDACGNVLIGPFVGVPSGTTLQAVVLGFATGLVLPPTTYSSVQTYTVL